MKKTLILVSILVLLAEVSVSQNNSFYSSMDDALSLHTSSDNNWPNDSFKSVEAFVKIAQDNPDRWEPYFWASYVYTQIARGISPTDLETRNLTKEKILDLSQEYLSKAKGDMITTEELASDYHVLQSLIYTFRASFSQSDTERYKYIELQKESLYESIKSDNENPVSWVLIGTELYSRGIQEGNYGMIAAAKVMLKEAGEIFEMNKKDSITQNNYWNAAWYKFWLGRAERFLNAAD
ncbi:MAG: hypothetical protein JJ971_05095 [Balneolaceae bacterium]|nr:hypothetical protein [Balneolaceae bacterium]MBO6545753.1 hypothetical protein [Balneolaceae bacterium]MBO6647149.1 hypothetical protein [Balneolaceae bacterium]